MGKSATKKYEAMQDRIAKRFDSVDKINPFTAGWMFNAWYEKIILIILMCLGIWKLFEVIFL